MNKVVRFALLMALFALLLTVPAVAQEEGGPAQVGLRPDAPMYALHGPYWVGTQTFVGEDVDGSLDMRVWYPALNPDNVPEVINYVYHWNKWVFEGFDSGSISDIAGHALANAQPDVSAAPYPLVVFSHGSGSESPIYAWFLEHIASYGYVVIAPEHKEILDGPGSDFARTTIARPQTISHALDYSETLTAASGVLAGMIDLEHVAVAGQSYGGYSALAVGGARLDMTGYEARCNALPDDDPDKWLCFLVPAQEEMAQDAGLASAPQGLWPSMADPRVDAVITIAGDSYMFAEEGLAQVTVPVLAIGGTRDTATAYQWGIRPTYDNISSEQKILAALENADHYVALTSCEDAPSLGDMGLYFFCSDAVWEMGRAHDVINQFATAFLLDVLKGDEAAHAALAPDAVSFPGIHYEAQGF